MKLVDTSAWVDFLRGADSRATDELRRMIDAGDDIATTEPVIMELLAGAVDDSSLRQIEVLTGGLALAAIDPGLDYRDAAMIFRAGRRQGSTVRRLTDCLIAAVALRHGLPLVHKDADFEAIAKVTPLDEISLR